MISQVGQIMVYVNDQDKAVRFWTEVVGFQVRQEENDQGIRWIEVAPTENAETTIVLHNKAVIAKLEPELNLDTPSLMFFTPDLQKFHQHLSNQNITVGQIVDTPSGKVFNFADFEENYFAVMEKK